MISKETFIDLRRAALVAPLLVALLGGCANSGPTPRNDSRREGVDRRTAESVLAMDRDSAYSEILSIWGNGDQRKAGALADLMLIESPGDQRLRFLLAAFVRSSFDIDSAGPYLQQVVASDPDSRLGHIASEIIALDSGLPSAAHLRRLRILVAEEPDDLIALWMLAVQCRTHKLTNEGIGHYSRLTAQLQNPPALVLQTYANLLDDAGRFEEALPIRQQAVERSEAAWVYQGLGNTLTMLNRFAEADRAYEEMLDRDPENGAYWASQALSYMRRGERDLALDTYEKALGFNPLYVEAFVNASVLYHDEGDHALEISTLERPAEHGLAEAQLRLARIYLNPKHPAHAPELGVLWLTKAADQGYPEAVQVIVYVYFQGLPGVPKDSSAGVAWLESAHAQGDPELSMRVVDIYLRGRGDERDAVRAVEILTELAEGGDAEAQARLGNLLMRDDRVPQNLSEGARWLREAADQGSSLAAASLSSAYHVGRGVPVDADQALILAKRAAEQGYAPAQWMMARYYYEGFGAERDLTQSVRWLRAAAVQGLGDAQLGMGQVYRDGMGVEKDPIEAFAWLYLAYKNDRTREKARGMMQGMRRTMGQAQVDRAVERASEVTKGQFSPESY